MHDYAFFVFNEPHLWRIPNVYSTSERWSSQSSKALVEAAVMAMAAAAAAATCGSEGEKKKEKKRAARPPAINPRYYPRYVSDMLLATPATRDSFCHYIRGVTPTPPPSLPRLHLLHRV